MSLTIQLPSKLEQQLREQAASEGLQLDRCVLNVLKGRAKALPQKHGTDREAELLEKINVGLPDETWKEYFHLTKKRQKETITTDELKQLIAITDQIEELHADRMPYLIELAALRNVTLEKLIRDLGIKRRNNGIR
ncbi:MAG: hypothetical protein R2830_06635 [Saprospiraceae bacterium]